MAGIMLPTTLLTAAAIGTVDLWLGLRIVRTRLRDQVLIGDNGDDKLAGQMRAHANLVEYAPFVLILMALIEAMQGSGEALAITGAVFVAARIAHPIGMELRRPNLPRGGGAILTWLVLAFLIGWAVLIVAGQA